jgi:hypothetical protein
VTREWEFQSWLRRRRRQQQQPVRHDAQESSRLCPASHPLYNWELSGRTNRSGCGNSLKMSRYCLKLCHKFFFTVRRIHNSLNVLLPEAIRYELPTTPLNETLFQKGILYSGCKIYNRLPPYIKSLSNDLKCFKSSLKGYLMERTLYSIDEFHQIT